MVVAESSDQIHEHPSREGMDDVIDDMANGEFQAKSTT